MGPNALLPLPLGFATCFKLADERLRLGFMQYMASHQGGNPINQVMDLTNNILLTKNPMKFSIKENVLNSAT